MASLSVRICFSIREQLRPFFWVTLADSDGGSVYFGMPGSPEQKFELNTSLPFVKSPLAERVAKALLSHGHGLFESNHVKYSLHASGKFHQPELPKVECFKLSKRRYVSLASIFHKPLELISPTTETRTNKFAIRADHLTNVVVGSAIYLKRANSPNPVGVEAKRSKYAIFEVHEYEFGKYDLCVALYSDPRFKVVLPTSIMIAMPVPTDHEAHIGKEEPIEAFTWIDGSQIAGRS